MARKTIVGEDVFVHAGDCSADYLAGRLQALTHQPRTAGFKLQMITNRGVKVWPGGCPETFCTDHWRCRFLGADNNGGARAISNAEIVSLLHNLTSQAAGAAANTRRGCRLLNHRFMTFM